MKEISKLIRETVSWCMLFADDFVLVAETKEEVNNKLEDWRPVLEGEPEMTIGEEVIASTNKFKNLGLIIQGNGEIDKDVTHRIQAGWLKWRATTRVLCDRKFLNRLKSKFYRVAISLALLYGTKYWLVKKTFEHKIEVIEMRILSWMCGQID
ncbi:uncharacterized protein LOC130802526 [Amaranthus tricolor]|uniref:uncharacterized protein LOC130802526 n=1 Tax=Amaranthus tricolor TaxID=29722 RepID=UPI00258F7A22|nr:uncharacterized protein LOC130802526 [Amaranthus tricolor]